MWIQIAILIISAVISRAMAPAPPKPKPQNVETPIADEGRAIRKIYGTVWIDDSMIIAFDKVGTDRIRTKGGKK